MVEVRKCFSDCKSNVIFYFPFDTYFHGSLLRLVNVVFAIALAPASDAFALSGSLHILATHLKGAKSLLVLIVIWFPARELQQSFFSFFWMRNPFADKISKLSEQNILISPINVPKSLFRNLSVTSEVMGGMPKKKSEFLILLYRMKG